jgi:hypothetical protein
MATGGRGRERMVRPGGMMARLGEPRCPDFSCNLALLWYPHTADGAFHNGVEGRGNTNHAAGFFMRFPDNATVMFMECGRPGPWRSGRPCAFAG